MPREPLFLARRTYRRRRLIDALRLIPALGALLFLLPVLSHAPGTGATFAGGVYLFSVWATLIVLSALLSSRLARFDEAAPDETADAADRDGDDDGDGGSGSGRSPS